LRTTTPDRPSFQEAIDSATRPRPFAALLGIPEEAFFKEMPGSGRATPDPLELSELVEVFRRIENPDDRRRVLEVAKSTLEQGGVAESSPMHGRGRLPLLNAAGFPGDGKTIER
jgi:hypothetical protein